MACHLWVNNCYGGFGGSSGAQLFINPVYVGRVSVLKKRGNSTQSRQNSQNDQTIVKYCISLSIINWIYWYSGLATDCVLFVSCSDSYGELGPAVSTQCSHTDCTNIPQGLVVDQSAHRTGVHYPEGGHFSGHMLPNFSICPPSR